MSDIILKAQNISKQYRLGLIGTGTISHDLNRWWHKVRGKDDPFLKVGETNDRSSFGKSDYVWALQDINFELKRGEVLGIIGKNGAGKSTLLKILSRVTSPTTGEIKTKGRIASLLEVGTGFHPEMTGRENIYLNGAILGMTKKEIRSKEDEIIDFSGCQRYIDTPVKRYSSGMRVRLAFAVAAHLEPDILVIDEVLAVGDAEFQKKAIGKMQDISKGEGRTVLFVSHNMAAVQNLCTRAIVLEHGEIYYDGETENAINKYLNLNVKSDDKQLIWNERTGNGKIKFSKVKVYDENKLGTGKEIKIGFWFEKLDTFLNPIKFGLSIWSVKEVKLISINTDLNGGLTGMDKVHNNYIECKIPKIPLVEGDYWLNFTVFSKFGMEDYIEKGYKIHINATDFYGNSKPANSVWGFIALNHNWVING